VRGRDRRRDKRTLTRLAPFGRKSDLSRKREKEAPIWPGSAPRSTRATAPGRVATRAAGGEGRRSVGLQAGADAPQEPPGVDRAGRSGRMGRHRDDADDEALAGRGQLAGGARIVEPQPAGSRITKCDPRASVVWAACTRTKSAARAVEGKSGPRVATCRRAGRSAAPRRRRHHGWLRRVMHEARASVSGSARMRMREASPGSAAEANGHRGGCCGSARPSTPCCPAPWETGSAS